MKLAISPTVGLCTRLRALDPPFRGVVASSCTADVVVCPSDSCDGRAQLFVLHAGHFPCPYGLPFRLWYGSVALLLPLDGHKMLPFAQFPVELPGIDYWEQYR